VRRDSLDRFCDDGSGPLLAVIASRELGFPHSAGYLVAQLLLELAHEDALRLLPGHVGDPLKFSQLLLGGLFELHSNLVEGSLTFTDPLLAPLDVFETTFEVLFLLVDPALELLGLGPDLASFLLGRRTNAYGFLLGLQQSLFGGAFRLADPPPALDLGCVEFQALVPAEAGLSEDVYASAHKDRGAHHQEQNDGYRHWLVHLLLIRL